MWPHRKKSISVRSGHLGGHALGCALRPVVVRLNICSKLVQNSFFFFFRILQWFCFISNVSQTQYDGAECCKDASPTCSSLTINFRKNLAGQTLTRSKLSHPDHIHLTPFSSEPGHKPRCHDEIDTQMSLVMTTCGFGVYHLPNVFGVHINIIMKFSAPEGLGCRILKLIRMSLSLHRAFRTVI